MEGNDEVDGQLKALPQKGDEAAPVDLIEDIPSVEMVGMIENAEQPVLDELQLTSDEKQEVVIEQHTSQLPEAEAEAEAEAVVLVQLPTVDQPEAPSIEHEIVSSESSLPLQPVPNRTTIGQPQESTILIDRHQEGVMRLMTKQHGSPEAADYPENDGDDIIWPDEKSYSEDLIPEYFLEAMDEDALMSLQTRDDLVAAYKAMIQDRNRLLITNQKLQTKAMDFLQKKKVATIQRREPSMRMQIDYEEKFSRYLYVWESLMATYTKDEEQLSSRFKMLSQAYERKLAENERENKSFIQFKRTHIKGAINSQTGERLTEQAAELLLQKELSRQEELKNLRMINFNMKYRIKKKELSVHSKEGLAGGHHMYDFEQLKIENQAYNEKIEERNEELSKLRRKIMNTLQVMGHIKEKIFFMVNENEATKRILAELDADANKKRERLSKMKQVKDSLREDRSKLQQRSGLLGKSLMLRDMRLKQENIIQLKNELNNLKINHHGYTAGIESLNTQFKLANLNLSDYN